MQLFDPDSDPAVDPYTDPAVLPLSPHMYRPIIDPSRCAAVVLENFECAKLRAEERLGIR